MYGRGSQGGFAAKAAQQGRREFLLARHSEVSQFMKGILLCFHRAAAWRWPFFCSVETAKLESLPNPLRCRLRE